MFTNLIIGSTVAVPGRDALGLGRRLALDTGARPAVIYVRPDRALGVEAFDDKVDRILDEAHTCWPTCLAPASGARPGRR
jgi:hypothetical protein